MSRDWIDDDTAVEFLRSQSVQGTDDELRKLAQGCDHNPQALERVAEILRSKAEGQISQIIAPSLIEPIIDVLLPLENSFILSNFLAVYFPSYLTARRSGNFQSSIKLHALLAQKIDALDSAEDDFWGWSSHGYPLQSLDYALLLTEVGELQEAKEILYKLGFQLKSNYRAEIHKGYYEYIARENLCDVLVLDGHLGQAEQISTGIIQAYETDDFFSEWGMPYDFLSSLHRGEYTQFYSFTTGANPYARRAVARFLQGKISAALHDFENADEFQQKKLTSLYEMMSMLIAAKRHKKFGGPEPDFSKFKEKTQPLTGQAAIYYAMLLTRLGKFDTALKVLDYSKEWAAHPDVNWPGTVAYAELALSDVYRLKGDYKVAGRSLAYPLEWAIKSGQQEIYCWVYLSNAQLELLQNNLDKAQSFVEEAYQTATARGFKLYEIDCSVTAGRIAMLQDKLETARQKATHALNLSGDPDCTYAWGHGNALHLLGEILIREGDQENAHQVLSGAIKLRTRIQDPRLTNTQELLAQLPQAKESD